MSEPQNQTPISDDFLSDMMVGGKIGRWIIYRRLPNNKRGQHVFKCRCKCGRVRSVLKTSLLSKRSTSCRNCR